jgi:hypothetical protein
VADFADKRINHPAIGALVILQQLLSFAWYSPYGFGFKWINLAGYRISAVPPADTFGFYKPFLVSILSSFLLCYGLAILIKTFNIVTARRGLILAGGCWLAFSFATLLTHNEFANRPWMLTFIDTGRDGLMFISAGLILPVWRKKHRERK